jgi:hypothetical protein
MTRALCPPLGWKGKAVDLVGLAWGPSQGLRLQPDVAYATSGCKLGGVPRASRAAGPVSKIRKLITENVWDRCYAAPA